MILALGLFDLFLTFSHFLTGTHTCGFDSTVRRVWNPQYKSWSVFSQDHLVKTLLGSDVGEQHNAALDALKSIRLASTTSTTCSRGRAEVKPRSTP